MNRLASYRILCGVSGALFVLGGFVLFLGFFQFHAPGSEAADVLPVGPNGAYFMAMSGCALIAWGGCLLGTVRRPEEATWVATYTAFALVLMALYRILAWVVGDYSALGNALRVEAAVFLSMALGFLWLRPARKTATAS